MSLFIIIALSVYLLLMLVIGYFSSKRIDAYEDFSIAGRRLTPLLLGCSLAATELGVGSTLGVFEKAYGEWGLSASWYILAMGFAFIIISVFGPKLRKTEVSTVPEYFRRRYGTSSGLISSILMILPLIILLVIQLVAAGTVLSILLSIKYKYAVTIIAFVIIAYTILGGIWGVAITDFVQVILIVVGLFLVFLYSIRLCINFPKAMSNIPKDSLDLFKGFNSRNIISLVIMYIATFTVGQEVAVNYYSINHSYDSTKGTILTAMLVVFFAFIPTFLGLITLALSNLGYLNVTTILNDGIRYALPNLALTVMPPFMIGVLFLSILAATMSSADSDLLAIGSIFSNDIYKAFLDKTASSKQLIWISRLSMGMVGIVAYLLALFNSGSILIVLIFVFSLRAAGAFIPYVFGLYWNKSSTAGTIASLILGSVSFVLFEAFNIRFFSFEPIVYSLIVSLIAFIVFSKLFPPVIETLDLIDE